MNLEATYDLIEQYLNNSLSTEELALVEERLKNDSDFAQEVEAHRMTNELLIDNALIDIKNELQNIHTENLKNNQSKLNKTYYYLSALTIGLGVTGLLLYNKNIDEKKSNILIEQTLNKDISSSKFELIEDVNRDLEEKFSSKTTTSQQDNSTELEAKSSSKSISNLKSTEPPHLPTSVIVKEILPIEPSKNKTEVEPVVNYKKADIEKAASNPLPITTLLTHEKFPCEDIIIKPEYTLDKITGDITIDTKNIQGTPPFQYSIDGGKTFSENSNFKSEARSNYLLLIVDQKNCKSEVLTIKIPNTKNYVMYPDKQKYCEIVLNRFEGAPVNIKISNARTGMIVYHAALSGVTEYIWEGVDQNNTALDMGNYVYEISSTQSALVLSGLITIVR